MTYKGIFFCALLASCTIITASKKAIEGLAIAGGVYAIYNVTKDIKSYVVPSQEEKYRAAILKSQAAIAKFQAQVAEEKSKVLNAEKAFRECLVKNEKGKRDPSGRPCACLETMRAFAMASESIDDVEKITQEFNKDYPETK